MGTLTNDKELQDLEKSVSEECDELSFEANAKDDREETEYHPVVIVGGGIGGLVLALCLDEVYNHAPNDHQREKNNIPIHVYESASAYNANVGGAIGLYPNGLRVLHHLSQTNTPKLLDRVREAGCAYVYRRWMRHDGTEVAVAREDELLPEINVVNSNLSSSNYLYSSYKAAESYAEMSGGERGNNLNRIDLSSGGSIDSASHVDIGGRGADKRPKGGSLRSLREMSLRFSSSAGPDHHPSVQRQLSRNPLLDLFTDTRFVSGPSEQSNNSLSAPPTGEVGADLSSLGIRRWKFQQVLYEACLEVGIHIHFGKRLLSIESILPKTLKGFDTDDTDSMTLLRFKDGTNVHTSLLIGADGINSTVRSYVIKHKSPSTAPQAAFAPQYTGVTCLMGCANVPRPIRGICFPSSATTKCHACYYPTRVSDCFEGDSTGHEQVFQIYFPCPVERPDTWRTLTMAEAKEECGTLAKKMRADGWDEQFLAPLESPTLTGVLRVGLRSREALDTWHVGTDTFGGTVDGIAPEANANGFIGRAVLLGDAAHPAVPYIGQGAMMAMEDAGTLSLLLRHYCPLVTVSSKRSGTAYNRPDFSRFTKSMEVFEALRVSRTKAVLGSSLQLGKTQQKRADSKLYNAWREWSIKAQVWAHGTLPVMKLGASFDYRAKVEEILSKEENCSSIATSSTTMFA